MILRIAAIGLAVGAVALAVAVVAVGLFLSAPARAKVGAGPADLHAEEVTIASPSGATLRGWFIAGRPGGGAVVLMHGVQGNRLHMVPRARLLAAAGFSVLLFDFQAHGESSGDRITLGRLESLDAHAQSPSSASACRPSGSAQSAPRSAAPPHWRAKRAASAATL
jgi:uncharacterized protein